MTRITTNGLRLILLSHHRHLFWPHQFLSPAHTDFWSFPSTGKPQYQTPKTSSKILSVSKLKRPWPCLISTTILASSLFTDPNCRIDDFEQQMENTITSILNEFAPFKTGHRSGPRQTKNWLSPEAVEAKKCRHRLEQRWKTSNAEPNRLAYRAACCTANDLIMKSHAAFNLECINSCSKNPKSLWTTIESILHSSTPAEQLPPAVSKPLASFSVRKLSLSNSPYPPNSMVLHLHLFLTSPTLDKHSMTSHLSLQPKLQNCSTNRHHLIKFPHLCSRHAPAHSQFSYLTSQTCRLIRPLSHQNSNMLSLHPFWRSSPNQILQISGLFPIRTLLAKYWNARLFPHLSISPSFSPLQSAYQKFHSTETAFLKLTNDIMDSTVSVKVTILAALDMSAALALWTTPVTPPFFIGLHIHSVCQELFTPGFTHNKSFIFC